MRPSSAPLVLPAGTIMGYRVHNSAREDLGEILDLMIDVDSGRIAYAVLSFGGFLGLGDKLFALPWQVLEMDPQTQEFLLDVPREMLKQAPGFDKHEWPTTADRKWQEEVHAHYRIAPYWEDFPPAPWHPE